MATTSNVWGCRKCRRSGLVSTDFPGARLAEGKYDPLLRVWWTSECSRCQHVRDVTGDRFVSVRDLFNALLQAENALRLGDRLITKDVGTDA